MFDTSCAGHDCNKENEEGVFAWTPHMVTCIYISGTKNNFCEILHTQASWCVAMSTIVNY